MSNYDMTFDKKIADDKCFDTIFGAEEDSHLLDLVLKEDSETFGKDVRDPDAVEDGLGKIGAGKGLGNDVGPDHDSNKPKDDTSDQKIITTDGKELKTNDQLNTSDKAGGTDLKDGTTVNVNDVRPSETELVGNDPIPDEKKIDDATEKFSNIDKFEEAMNSLLDEANEEFLDEDNSDVKAAYAARELRDRTSHSHNKEENAASKEAKERDREAYKSMTGSHEPAARNIASNITGHKQTMDTKKNSDIGNKKATDAMNSSKNVKDAVNKLKEADLDIPTSTDVPEDIPAAPSAVNAPPAVEEPPVAAPAAPAADTVPSDEDILNIGSGSVAPAPAVPAVPEEPEFTVDDLDAADVEEAAEPVNVDDVKDKADPSKIEDGLGKMGQGEGHGNDLGPDHDAIKPSDDTSDQTIITKDDKELKQDQLNTSDEAGAKAVDGGQIKDTSNVGEDHKSADDSFKETTIEDLEEASVADLEKTEADEDEVIDAVKGNKEGGVSVAELTADEDEDDELLSML